MSFSSIPDEITENILARVSRLNYPSLSLVSKRFHSILSSMEIYKTRSQIGTTETCVYIYVGSKDVAHSPMSEPRWFCLCLKPNQTRTKQRRKLKFMQISNGNLLVPIPLCSPPSPLVPHYSKVVVGSKIYVIAGPYNTSSSSSSSSDVWILDCRSHTWSRAPNIPVALKNVSAVFIDEKIYVLGDNVTNKSASYFEVLDLKTQSWRALQLPDNDLHKYYNCYVVEGKVYVESDEKDYTYDPKEGTWKVAREEEEELEESIFEYVAAWCVIENVTYAYTYFNSLMWYDSECRKWKVIKGLEEFHEDRTRGLENEIVLTMVEHGGKLLVMWKVFLLDQWKEEYLFAQIALETRRNGCEVRGMVECVDVMFTVTRDTFVYIDCFSVSV